VIQNIFWMPFTLVCRAKTAVDHGRSRGSSSLL